MEKNQTQLKDFDILQKLGEGAFGQVFKVKRKIDSQIYAMKKVKIKVMNQRDRQNALNQIRILASYNGQYIIGYKDSFYDQESSALYVVMEFASGGDLLKKNQRNIKNKTFTPEEEIWKAIVHISKGLKQLHDRKILHRDLKAANVFITGEGIYKLGDLNVSKVLKKDLTRTQTGTPYYVSPQIWKSQPYGAKTDIWSLGCLIYQMAALRPPFLGNDMNGLSKNVCKGIYPRIPLQYSQDLVTFINACLKQNPFDRPSTDKILSNPVVQSRFKGETNIKISNEPLLQTLKLKNRNFKGLKMILPKANYQDKGTQDIKTEQSEKQNGTPATSRSARKSIKDIMNDRKVNIFIEKMRKKQQQDRQRILKKLQKNQEQSIQGRPRRPLSAIGLRKNSQRKSLSPPNIKKQPQNRLPPSSKNSRKQLPKLPPKPNINAMKPPKYYNQRVINRSVDRSGSRDRKSDDSYNQQRENSREKFVKLGQKIAKGSDEILEKPRQRCNSYKKIIYPSWWCD